MRLTITTGGSRGDLQPFLALGGGLKAAGHAVRLAAHPYYEPEVRAAGLGYRPARGPHPKDEMRVTSRGGDFGGVMRRWVAVNAPHFESLLRDYVEACSDTDAVLYTPLGFLGVKVAEALGLPCVGAVLSPAFSPTRRYPSALTFPALLRLGMDGGVIGGACNRLSHAATERVFWRSIREAAGRAVGRVLGEEHVPAGNPFRELEARRQPVLQGWSEAVLPPPTDRTAWTETTGYWFLDESPGWRPPPDLADFLEAGPPPVCVGFGSMSGADAERTTEAVLGAVDRARRRAVLLTGWGGITNAGLPDEVFKTQQVPHCWLFERVSLAVHHGGAGTTAAAFRAGIPQVVVPFFGDQRFWGIRAESLGVAPAPIPIGRLTPERLARALTRATTDAAMRRTSRLLGERVRSEDGVARAVESLERLLPAV